MTESKPTRGHYTFVHQFNVECDRRGIANCGGYSPSHGQQEAFEENKANALLVADAFNVYNETGLTPRQLAEQLESLIANATDLCGVIFEYENMPCDSLRQRLLTGRRRMRDKLMEIAKAKGAANV